MNVCLSIEMIFLTLMDVVMYLTSTSAVLHHFLFYPSLCVNEPLHYNNNNNNNG